MNSKVPKTFKVVFLPNTNNVEFAKSRCMKNLAMYSVPLQHRKLPA